MKTSIREVSPGVVEARFVDANGSITEREYHLHGRVVVRRESLSSSGFVTVCDDLARTGEALTASPESFLSVIRAAWTSAKRKAQRRAAAEECDWHVRLG